MASADAGFPQRRSATDVLVGVDLQNDFCPDGALGVPRGDEIVPLVNRLMDEFDHVVLTQDWHPRDHRSFASAHPGRVPFDTVEMPYGTQILWPDHCVQGSRGAAFHADLRTDRAELVIRKGFRRDIDSYSTFFENDRTTSTGLAGYLRDRGFSRVFLAGLATDFCVRYSALDARRCGFEAVVMLAVCRAIDVNGSAAEARHEMRAAGVRLVENELA